MKDSEEILDNAALKVSQILRISLGEIDKTKFIYLYTLLYTVMGQGEGGDENMRHFLNTFNKHLGFCPAARLDIETELDKIIGYLETHVDR
jgi:hypothetical protein